MPQPKIAQGDLLYHAVHGLCRMDKMTKEKQGGKDVIMYSLVPKVANRMKMRFTIAATDLEASGFHTVVSLKEANKILDYLKAGDKEAIPAESAPRAVSAFAQPVETWGLAQTILSFAREKFEAKDQRKRQMLERSAKGLVGELAFVFKSSLKETAEKVQSSLGKPSKVNPSVLLALTNAGDED